MPAFSYKENTLYVENVAVKDIAANIETPFYCYSFNEIRDRFDGFKKAAATLKEADICFAVKANADLAVLQALAERGAGADVVSGGELALALRAGIPASKIVFSGVGKTPAELHDAVRADIKMINLESFEEARVLNEISKSYGKKTPVSVRINPDVEAHTHEKISTGKKENKFGVDFETAREIYRFAKESDGLDPVGADMHIGSQLLDVEPFRQAFLKLRGMLDVLRADGLDIRVLDLGGGLGVAYSENDKPAGVEDYIAVVRETLGDAGCSFVFEPGRYLIAPAGILVARVVYVKEAKEKRFALVDAGMHNLIRPAMYDSYHGVLTIDAGTDDTQIYDVAGPVCESSDVFAKARALPVLKQGDLIAFETAGAYGETMASNYNMHPLCAAVMVNDTECAVIRRAQTLDEILSCQSELAWRE